MKNRVKIKNITQIALGAVLLAVCSWISVMSVSMQTFAVYFLIYFFGGKKATASISVYLLMGALGVPVFAGFAGGIGWLFGPTGGFLLGFIMIGAAHIAAETIFGEKLCRWYIRIPLSLLTLIACYSLGALSTLMYGNLPDSNNNHYLSIFLGCFQLYAVFDIPKLIFAYYAARYMERSRVRT